MGERYKMKTFASKTNNHDFLLKYKQLSNKVTKECRVTKDLYYNTLVLENLDNQDRLLKTLKRVYPKPQLQQKPMVL